MRQTFADAFTEAPMSVLRGAAFAQLGDVFRDDPVLFHDLKMAAAWEIHARIMPTPTGGPRP